MTKKIHIISITAMTIVTLVTVSCTKEPDLSGYLTREELLQAGYMTREEFEQWQNEHSGQPTQIVTVHDFSVTIPAITQNDYYVLTRYYGLQGIIKPNDVVLVYFKIVSRGGWILLPYSIGNASYSYAILNGIITFEKNFATLSSYPAENFQARAFIIPSTIYTSKCNSGVNHSSYKEVATAYGLTE